MIFGDSSDSADNRTRNLTHRSLRKSHPYCYQIYPWNAIFQTLKHLPWNTSAQKSIEARLNNANNLQYFTTVKYGNPEDHGRPNLVEEWELVAVPLVEQHLMDERPGQEFRAAHLLALNIERHTSICWLTPSLPCTHSPTLFRPSWFV